MSLDTWYFVAFDEQFISLKIRDGVTQIRWDTIIRVCYRVQSIPWLLTDEIYIFTSDRPESYLIPTEAFGGPQLWGEIVRRGKFDEKLAKEMIKKDGLYCWPPVKDENGIFPADS
jgi:hypothetical protein